MIPFDVERIRHIEFVTNRLHDEVTYLYELMCDKQDKQVIAHIKNVVTELNMLLESLYDEDEPHDPSDLTKLL